MSKKIFEQYVTFPANAAANASQSLDVPLPSPEEESPEGYYLLSVLVDQQLGTGVSVTVYNRIPLETPHEGLRYAMVPVGAVPTLTVSQAGGSESIVVQGWLVGRSPAQIQVSLTGAASATGGRVWIIIYSVGRSAR